MTKFNAMVERIKVDPHHNLQVIDDVNIDFLLGSQTIHECWYAMNLGTECCECEDVLFIWKHLLDIRKLVDEKFTYLKHMLFIEEDELVKISYDVGEA